MVVMTCVVRRQELNISVPTLVAGTYDYINVNGDFSTEWDGMQKWIHFRSAEDPSYVIHALFVNDTVGQDVGIDLEAGLWEVWIHGAKYENNELIQRLTTNVKTITVEESGVNILPEVPESATEQITAVANEALEIAQAIEDAAENGEFDGATFTPNVSTSGVISWTNDKGLPNPASRNIKGPQGNTGNGISNISKTSTSGLVDTYTVTFTNGNTTTFTVTNGEKGDKGDKGDTGVSISSISKTGTAGLVDTYTITFSNGNTSTFTVTNGEDGNVMGGSIAPDFSDSIDYRAGDFVMYSGQLYQFTAGHAAGAWSGSDANAVALANRVNDNERWIKGNKTNIYYQEYVPAGSSKPYTLTKGGFYVNTGRNFSSTSGAYYRTTSDPFLIIGARPIRAVLGLEDYEWTCYSYAGLTWTAASHSNTGYKYISGTEDIYIPIEPNDTRFCITFRKKDLTPFTEEEVSTVQNALRFYTRPSSLNWWEVPSSYTAENPIYPANVPTNTYTCQTGSIFGGFIEKGVELKPNITYWLVSYRSVHNGQLRSYYIYDASGKLFYVCTTINGGSTLSIMKLRQTGNARIMWIGDSIIRGRIGGQSTLVTTPIPERVGIELGCYSQNFGVGNMGWIAGYNSSTSPSKTNAIGYLKRVGDSNYYDPNDAWSGYKFRGTGNWSDFNCIVFQLGVNDNNYPLGSLEDIDDTLSYAEVMSWKTSAQDPSSEDRTIVKAIYQCYRYIRESETAHAEGEPYVPNGYCMLIVLADPYITGSTTTPNPPSWGYDTVRAGGFTRTQLNQLLKDFAKKYGCAHIENYDAPIDRVNIVNSLPDGVHPNADTYYRLGLQMAGKISSCIS